MFVLEIFTTCRDAPLYLEWAPENIFCPTPPSACEEQKNVVGEKNVKKVLVEESMEGVPEEDIDPDRVEVRHFLCSPLGCENFYALLDCEASIFSNFCGNIVLYISLF